MKSCEILSGFQIKPYKCNELNKSKRIQIGGFPDPVHLQHSDRFTTKCHKNTNFVLILGNK